MHSIYELLDSHLSKYPLMEIQDMVKLLYQHELGPGHMITDEAQSLHRLETEWKTLTPSDSVPLFESIGNNLVRVHLAALGFEELPVLNRMFCATANYTQGSPDRLLDKLDCLTGYCKGADSFLSDYIAKGCPPVSHSSSYRQAYHPAYRVVSASHASFLSLIRTLRSLLSKKESVILAIDGCCASGKTSLSRLLADCFDCNIIPMDDFFLPPQLRTPVRLASPGGNIHSERFKAEVIEPLLSHAPISYRRFDCHTMNYTDMRILSDKPLTIIEGVYCMRPEFRCAYDYTVFLSCSYEQQTARILQRNGETMLQNFVNRWIPMENAYFDFYQLQDVCDCSITT